MSIQTTKNYICITFYSDTRCPCCRLISSRRDLVNLFFGYENNESTSGNPKQQIEKTANERKNDIGQKSTINVAGENRIFRNQQENSVTTHQPQNLYRSSSEMTLCIRNKSSAAITSHQPQNLNRSSSEMALCIRNESAAATSSNGLAHVDAVASAYRSNGLTKINKRRNTDVGLARPNHTVGGKSDQRPQTVASKGALTTKNRIQLRRSSNESCTSIASASSSSRRLQPIKRFFFHKKRCVVCGKLFTTHEDVDVCSSCAMKFQRLNEK